ncbi:MAG: helix-turn-helix transcriptional regulator [Spirochaetaceae bacterium]|nr:helix-turn-helix transcriptional regulator [Spirochaetaceae bacterium]
MNIVKMQVYIYSMKDELSNFSKNLKAIRKRRGLSQYDLSDLTGISQRMIGHYETKVSSPPLDKIEILAKALNVNPEELLKSHGKKENESEVDISTFDTRSLKKLQDILSLPPNDRAMIYRMLNKLLRENQQRIQ